jgi:hypothetical protein
MVYSMLCPLQLTVTGGKVTIMGTILYDAVLPSCATRDLSVLKLKSSFGDYDIRKSLSLLPDRRRDIYNVKYKT